MLLKVQKAIMLALEELGLLEHKAKEFMILDKEILMIKIFKKHWAYKINIF